MYMAAVFYLCFSRVAAHGRKALVQRMWIRSDIGLVFGKTHIAEADEADGRKAILSSKRAGVVSSPYQHDERIVLSQTS